MNDNLLSIPETAEQTGLSPHTIRSFIQRRLIQHYKLGGRVLISQAAVSEFLASRLVEKCVSGSE